MNKNLYILLIGGAVLIYFLKKNIIKPNLKRFKVQTPGGGLVNVRTQPDISSPIDTKIPNGAIFVGEVYNDDWVKIIWGNNPPGFINKINLIEI